MVETTLSRILIQNLSFLKMFLRVNLFVIISLYRVFLLRFGSEGMFQFLFHQQICLIHHFFFSMVAPNQRSSISIPSLLMSAKMVSLSTKNGCFFIKIKGSRRSSGTNLVLMRYLFWYKGSKSFLNVLMYPQVLLCCPSLEVPDCK